MRCLPYLLKVKFLSLQQSSHGNTLYNPKALQHHGVPTVISCYCCISFPKSDLLNITRRNLKNNSVWILKITSEKKFIPIWVVWLYQSKLVEIFAINSFILIWFISLFTVFYSTHQSSHNVLLPFKKSI